MLTHTCIHIEREKERHCSSVNKDEDICSRASRERKRERNLQVYKESYKRCWKGRQQAWKEQVRDRLARSRWKGRENDNDARVSTWFYAINETR